MDSKIEIWGLIKPISTEILFQGQIKTLTFRIPTNDEDDAILLYLTNLEKKLREEGHDETYIQAKRVLMEGIARMAIALIAVDGHEIAEVYRSRDQRIEWIMSWPDSLFDKVADAYYLALEMPYNKLRDMIQDPSIAAALFGNGEESAATSGSDSN